VANPQRLVNSVLNRGQGRQLCVNLATYGAAAAIASLEDGGVDVADEQRVGQLLWILFPEGLVGEEAVRFLLCGAHGLRKYQSGVLPGDVVSEGLAAYGITGATSPEFSEILLKASAVGAAVTVSSGPVFYALAKWAKVRRGAGKFSAKASAGAGFLGTVGTFLFEYLGRPKAPEPGPALRGKLPPAPTEQQ